MTCQCMHCVCLGKMEGENYHAVNTLIVSCLSMFIYVHVWERESRGARAPLLQPLSLCKCIAQRVGLCITPQKGYLL